MSYTRAEAVKIINAYNTLRTWALEIVSDVPYTASVEYTDNPSISISGDEVILFWKEYDSDYYGSGSLEENEARFPVAALVFNAKELRATREKVKAKEAERQKKVRAAERAVEKDRQDARDRTEFIRLTNKFKHGIEFPEGDTRS